MTVFAGAMMASTGRASDDRVLKVRVAGFARRIVSALVDALLLGGIAAAVTVVAALALQVPIPTWRELGPDLLVAGILDRSPMAVGAVGLFVGVASLYQIYFGGVAGQTLGQRLVNVRIISVRGTAPGAARGAIRLLALGLSLLPAGLGWVWALFDRERRALHDHVAGTYVILER